MRVGVYTPQFRKQPAPALDVARRAESLGIDGVFLVDHLWPMGAPGGPSLSVMPMLGAIAAVTSHITVGTLVARVDLMEVDQLVQSFRAARDVAGEHRLIAGLGTGDRVTRAEDDEYGLLPKSYNARLQLLEEACSRLSGEGIAVWLAGSSMQVQAIAQRHGVPVNLWQPTADTLQQPSLRPFTWGGIVSGSPDEVAMDLAAPLRAGASWAVCGPKGGADRPGALELLSRIKARL